MLEQGQELARADGLRNVVFLVGDAVALPWLDGQFDLVVCRLTLHQVADPAAVVREMVRITRPGGRVGIIDMVADDDTAVAAETDRLERLRDPSHGRTLTLDEHHALLTGAGAVVASTATRDNVLDLEDWMERTGTPPSTREELRTRLAVELDGGAATGLRPSRRPDGTVVFTHRWACTIATA